MATKVLTIAAIQAYVNDDSTESVSLLEQLELDAIAELEMQSGRTIELDASAVARVLDGHGGGRLLLPTPITTGSATVRTRGSIGSDWVSQAEGSVWESRYRQEVECHELIRIGGGAWPLDGDLWPMGAALIEVTYKSGYNDGTGPAAPGWLRAALLRWIATEYRGRVQSRGIGDGEVDGLGVRPLGGAEALFSRHLRMLDSQMPPDRVALA